MEAAHSSRLKAASWAALPEGWGGNTSNTDDAEARRRAARNEAIVEAARQLDAASVDGIVQREASICTPAESAAALQAERANAVFQTQQRQRRDEAQKEALRERRRERNLAKNQSMRVSHKEQLEAARLAKLQAERQVREQAKQVAALALEAVRAEEAERRHRIHDRVVKSKYGSGPGGGLRV